jgi:AraC family transcriptional regulator, regulatory protein of adaptative response / methylated-DNA-[protein]-cysteine methyltransferase
VKFSLQNASNNSDAGCVTSDEHDRNCANQYRTDDHAGSRPATATEVIQFGIRQSSLRWILVASSAEGICAVLLGDDPKVLTADLRRRFPQAELIAGDAAFERLTTKVIHTVEAPPSKLDFPMDLRGTAFERRVWQALCEIPAGSTATYHEIARKIGTSTNAQDVAEACSANSLAVIVPCHRVIRSDGTLAGYRWGIKRKRALLEKEQVAVPKPGSLFHAALGTHQARSP